MVSVQADGCHHAYVPTHQTETSLIRTSSYVYTLSGAIFTFPIAFHTAIAAGNCAEYFVVPHQRISPSSTEEYQST
jgi:hypothetical protein